MSFRRFALIALMATTPLAAHANTITGPYVSGAAGYDITQTQHGHFAPGSFADGLGNSGGGSAQFRHQNGYTGFGAFGWGFGNGLRAEIEGDYFYSQINHVSRNAAVGKTGGGDRNYGAFVNVLYDIDLHQFGIDAPITPYVGVGAGYLWSSIHNTATHYASGQSTQWAGTNGSFAYQGIVGASYNIEDVPGLAITADYRMVGQNFYNGAYGSYTHGNGGYHYGHVNFDQRFNHQFNLGVRYAFNTAPPAPVATVVSTAPMPAPARTYLVFFNWDKFDLSDRAHSIVKEAAEATTHIQVTRIIVNGYTDNTAIHQGPRGEAYNLKLSEKRASIVKSELIKDGVPENVIDIHGYGDTKPLVPTAPNTREPQNRRVEIILR